MLHVFMAVCVNYTTDSELTGSNAGNLNGAGFFSRKNSSGVWNLIPILTAN
jgi:hypothetical protein